MTKCRIVLAAASPLLQVARRLRHRSSPQSFLLRQKDTAPGILQSYQPHSETVTQNRPNLHRAAPPEVLAGTVERVTFHNAESGFCVLKVKAGGKRDLVTVVGHAPAIGPQLEGCSGRHRLRGCRP